MIPNLSIPFWYPGINRSHCQARGLVVAIPFTESVGRIANDLTRGGQGARNGTGTAWKTTVRGRVATFNGTDDNYVFSFAGLPIGSENRTVTAWVRTTDTWEFAICWGERTVKYAWECIIGTDITRIGQPIGWRSFTATGSNNGDWHHFAWQLDGSWLSDTNAWMDGAELAESAIADAEVQTTNYAFRVGSRTDDARWFNGDLSDVRIYNTALSSAECQEIYLRGHELYLPTHNY